MVKKFKSASGWTIFNMIMAMLGLLILSGVAFGLFYEGSKFAPASQLICDLIAKIKHWDSCAINNDVVDKVGDWAGFISAIFTLLSLVSFCFANSYGMKCVSRIRSGKGAVVVSSSSSTETSQEEIAKKQKKAAKAAKKAEEAEAKAIAKREAKEKRILAKASKVTKAVATVTENKTVSKIDSILDSLK